MTPTDPASYPLPHDPVLAEVAAALRDTAQWAEIVDARWRIVYSTDDLNHARGFMVESVLPMPGVDYFSTEMLRNNERLGGDWSVDVSRETLAALGGWLLADLGGDRDAVRSVVDPRLHDVVDGLTATDRTAASSLVYHGVGVRGSRPKIDITVIRLHDGDGRLAGTVLIHTPHMSMSVLATLGAQGDPGHFERMQSVAAAARRPAAVLFADLEGSTSLGRRLSTAKYFSFGRRFARAADQCVIDAGGITGRHVGDGVVAFFVAENFSSESAAAGACIRASRSLTDAMAEVAERSDLEADDLTLRFGLHWGATLHIGLISTVGRTEVTALGDEVNECARIEACAAGGLTLASKALVERLTADDALALDLDPENIAYVQLGELATATEKARRDAPAIAVCRL